MLTTKCSSAKHKRHGRDTNAQVADDLRDVNHTLEKGSLVEDGRNDDGIPGVDGGSAHICVLATDDGAVRAQQKDTALIGLAIRTTGTVEIIADTQARSVDECVGGIDLAFYRHIGRDVGNHKAIPIFQRDIGHRVDSYAFGGELQHDAPDGCDISQPVDGGLGIGGRGTGGELIAAGDGSGIGSRDFIGDLSLQLVRVFMQTLGFYAPGGLAGELGGIQKSVRREAARSPQQAAEAFLRAAHCRRLHD